MEEPQDGRNIGPWVTAWSYPGEQSYQKYQWWTIRCHLKEWFLHSTLWGRPDPPKAGRGPYQKSLSKWWDRMKQQQKTNYTEMSLRGLCTILCFCHYSWKWGLIFHESYSCRLYENRLNYTEVIIFWKSLEKLSKVNVAIIFF